jgi:hypothetical protein
VYPNKYWLITRLDPPRDNHGFFLIEVIADIEVIAEH